MSKKKKRFESDTQKVVREHLSDPNHEISEEDIRNVRIGMTPPPPEDELKDRDEKVADRKTPGEDDILPGDQQATPWDTLRS